MSDKVFTTLTDVFNEIAKHDLMSFDTISAESEEVRLAVEYLYHVGKSPMAESLEKMAEAGQIRLGPVKGFVASAYSKDGQDYIVISNQYEDYHSRNEQVIDLVHEIQYTSLFNLPHQEDSELELSVLQWLNKREDAIKKAFAKLKDGVLK